MSTIENPAFDQAALDQLLTQFEQAGPSVPVGADNFCESFEAWIESGAAEPGVIDRYRADLLFIKGMLDSARGDFADAIDHLHDAIDRSKRAGETRRQIFSLCSLATCFEYAGMQEQASDSIFDALTLAEQLGDDRLRATVLHGLTGLFDVQGAYEQMLESASQSHSIGETLGDRRLVKRSASAVGLAYVRLGRSDDAIAWLKKALGLVRAETEPLVKTYLNMNLMHAYRCGGRLDEAIRLADEWVDQLVDLPAQHAAVLYVDAAEVHLAVGNFDRAQDLLARADAVSNPAWMKAHLLDYYRVSSDLHEAMHEPALALEMLRRRIELDDELRGRQAQTRLVALERHFAAELAAKTGELHQLRTVELVEKNDQLSRLVERNSQIIEVVVNDLKNPLAATRLLADVLLNHLDESAPDPDGNAVDVVQAIKSATVEMSEAVSRLLASQRRVEDHD